MVQHSKTLLLWPWVDWLPDELHSLTLDGFCRVNVSSLCIFIALWHVLTSSHRVYSAQSYNI
jgi:hypothetical protein